MITEDQINIINIFDFIQKRVIGTKHSNQIQEKEFIAKVREIAPNIVAICICYSHLSQVHLIMEKAGILGKERLERDFQIVTIGRSITLDETQSELLYCMSKPENITKTTIIHGPEGFLVYCTSSMLVHVQSSFIILVRQHRCLSTPPCPEDRISAELLAPFRP